MRKLARQRKWTLTKLNYEIQTNITVVVIIIIDNSIFFFIVIIIGYGWVKWKLILMKKPAICFQVLLSCYAKTDENWFFDSLFLLKNTKSLGWSKLSHFPWAFEERQQKTSWPVTFESCWWTQVVSCDEERLKWSCFNDVDALGTCQQLSNKQETTNKHSLTDKGTIEEALSGTRA